MKKGIFLLMLTFTFFFNMDTSLIAQSGNDLTEKISESLTKNTIDSAVFLEQSQKVDDLDNSVKDLIESVKELKGKPINSSDDFSYLLSFVLAWLTSLLTKIQRKGWLKNVTKPIIVVIGTGAALALAMTVFKGDWNILDFIRSWFSNSGGAVLIYELIIKALSKKAK